VSVLAKRVKLSDSKVAHLQNELSAYRQLSLQHMIAETELRCVRVCVCVFVRSFVPMNVFVSNCHTMNATFSRDLNLLSSLHENGAG
jgi:hypothetical protein